MFSLRETDELLVTVISQKKFSLLKWQGKDKAINSGNIWYKNVILYVEEVKARKGEGKREKEKEKGFTWPCNTFGR